MVVVKFWNSKENAIILPKQQGRSHWGGQEGHGPLTSTSEPKKVQQFHFQTSGILFFMGVQKL